MKWLAVLALTLWVTDPLRISKINRHKSAATQAYTSGNYAEAAKHYHYLLDSLGVAEEEILLNLAHSYFQLNEYEKAKQVYAAVAAVGKKPLQSVAHQQLGVIANREGKFQDALQHFREALKANPENEDARYNYELLKRKLKDQNNPQQNQQQQNNEQQQNQQQQKKQSDNQQSDKQKQQEQQKQSQQQQGKEQEKQEQEGKDNNRDEKQNQQLQGGQERKTKIDPQKAKEILESMRNQEIQYLQQKKRKGTKPRDKNKPDW
ncbi:MAG: tetratricopeptide repeat protein [Cyclobacteriaceae bacterium]|nr:tetratricopeptide repeat protein [Cyclobacteriaceae bacterium]